MWKIVENGEAARPADVDSTSSREYVYVRRNIECVTATEDAPQHYRWEEESIPRDAFGIYEKAVTTEGLTDIMLGISDNTNQNSTIIAKQLRRALEISAQLVTDESTMMEIADIYPEFKSDYNYKTGDIFKYGVNSDDETQLYQVLQNHKSSDYWKPDEAVSLYKKIGITQQGYSIWTQPYGASDAYQTGDIVQHNDTIWISTVDNNVWEPGIYGWNPYGG